MPSSTRFARATPRARPTGARDLFEGRFSEVLIIFVLALVVLGPEKLPRVVSEVGRWVGRARAMARQFREQLEEEVQLEQARRAESARAQATPPPAGEAAAEAAPATGAAAPPEPERPATYSHAHPTDATGARTPAAGEASQTPRADERGT